MINVIIYIEFLYELGALCHGNGRRKLYTYSFLCSNIFLFEFSYIHSLKNFDMFSIFI